MDRLLRRDGVLQVVAVLLALVLWVQAAAERNPEGQFTFDAVPVETAQVPSGLVVSGNPRPAKVNLTIRCRRRVFERLAGDSFTVIASLQGGQAGTYDYPVEVTLPEGVELVEISPAAVSVTLDRQASAEVPVGWRLTGVLPEGHSAGEVSVTPELVTVSGPAGSVSRVVRAVAQLDVSAVTGDFTTELPLHGVDAQGAVIPGLTFSPVRATVVIKVLELPAAVSLDVEPTLVGSPAEGYAVIGVSCSPTRASLRPGPGQTIDFNLLRTMPVDISGQTADVIATVGLALPETVASAVPAEVEVTVKIGPSMTLTDLRVEVRGAAPGLRVAAQPGTVDLVVRGPKPLLDQLKADDLSVWVSAAGLGAGTHQLPVNVELPAWATGQLEVAICSPATVTVTLGQ